MIHGSASKDYDNQVVATSKGFAERLEREWRAAGHSPPSLRQADRSARKTAGEIAKAAAELISGDRANQHGDKIRNHDNIAQLWQAYLDIRRDRTAPLSAADVAHMMALLKIARTQLGSFNLDDYVDLAGYAGCAGEIAGGMAP